ncbi:hypothetical protein [Bordetella sp. BOR01]|uniref:hypothetical protein n=1 Tax=Bordetella sp. BOR01 TaxID=2854779 RepID=UPI001C45CAAD|nr:hypothetical protein [Bordetella sp. BOR01]MBV7482645.1 hypothetical protein [Bordetella sp. BOR01]
MKLSMLALPVVAASLVLAGCGGHRGHDGDSTYDRSQTQSTTPPPPPASMPDNNSNTPGSQYPTTGGSR